MRVLLAMRISGNSVRICGISSSAALHAGGVFFDAALSHIRLRNLSFTGGLDAVHADHRQGFEPSARFDLASGGVYRRLSREKS